MLRTASGSRAVAAGSTERAIRLLERQGRRTYESGELTTLLGWLDALPRDRVASSPELVYLRAVACFFVGRVEEAARTCDAVRLRARATHRLVRCSRRAPSSPRSRTNRMPRTRSRRRGCHRRGSVLPRPRSPGTCDRLPRRRRAGVGRRDSEERPRPRTGSRRSALVVPTTTTLVSVLNLTGHLRDAEALCRQCLADHRAEVGHMAEGTPYALYWLGIVRYEANDLAEAVDALERGWAALGTFGFGRALLTSSVSYLALARQATGSPAGAIEAVRTVRHDARAAGLGGVETCWRRSRRGCVSCRATCLPRRAGRTSSAASGRGSRPRAPGAWPAWRGTWPGEGPARRRGGPRTPGCPSMAARSVASAANDTADLICIWVLDAVVAEAAGNRAAAQRALETAIRLAAPQGYVRRVVDDCACRGPPPARRAQGLAGVRRRGHCRARRGAHADDPAPAPHRSIHVAGRAGAALRGPDRARAGGPPPHGPGAPATPRSADELVVSLATAKWHAAHIRSKLGARSRTQALLQAQELGLV